MRKHILVAVVTPLIFFLGLVFGSVHISAQFSSAVNIPASYINMGTPHGLTALPDGNVWYVDITNGRIVKFNPLTNTILRAVGRFGSAQGEFDTGIFSITNDNNSNLYVLSTNCLLYKLDANGGFIASYDLTAQGGARCNLSDSIAYDAFTDTILVANSNTNYIARFSKDIVYQSGFGSYGTGNDQFDGLGGVATGSNGRIVVTDRNNARVSVFSSNYTYQFSILNWADEGGGTTTFSNLQYVTVLSDGTICASSLNNYVIEQFNSSGTHLRTIGHFGYDNSNLYYPESLTRDSANNIYVSDWGNTSINKYSSNGTYVNTLRNRSYDPGKLYDGDDLAYDSVGHIYTIDGGHWGDRQVQEWTASGTYMTTIIPPGSIADAAYHLAFGPDGRLYVSMSGGVQIFAKNPGDGTWAVDQTLDTGGFTEARGMAWDADGNFYVCDVFTNSVMKFDTDLNFVMRFGQGWNFGDPLPAEPGELVVANDIVIDSMDHVFVADGYTLQEFTTAGVYVDRIGNDSQMGAPGWVNLDNLNSILYVSDTTWKRVAEYSTAGAFLGTFGTYGTGQAQFETPTGSDFNPITHALTVADQGNGRLETFNEGTRIINLIPSANVVRVDNGESLSEKSWDPLAEDLSDIPARLTFGDYVVAEFHVDLTDIRDWSAVNVLTLPNTSKSLVVNLKQGANFAPGIGATHSLYIFRYANQHSVTVCPDATNWDGVALGCSNSYVLNEGDAGITPVTINGKNYWKIDNLTGTGAFSTLFETTFQLKDLMTRQKVSTGSDHRISFGTSYDLTHADDSMNVAFGPQWDFTNLVLGDISLLRGTTPLTLADTEDVDTWGVVWVGNQLIFVAPTNTGSTQGIGAGTAITVVVSNAHIINPATVESYLINLRMISDDGLGGQNVETGNINVPIVDDDQVNITGYINTYIYFDLDTNTNGSECAYNTCPLYTGAGAANNYTVDLGELNAIWVNKSQDAVFNHSDSGTGTINSIYLDLTTNAYGGAVVMVSSANGGLQGPGSNMIAAVTSGDDIIANSGSYGFTLPDLNTAAHGTINRNALCSSATTYCGLTTSQVQVINTAAAPLDTGHIRMDLGAAASYMNNPGSYTDTLTFVAIGSF